MTRDEFAAYLNSIRPGSDHTAEVWWDWAAELEEYERNGGELPPEVCKTAEVFLGEFADKIKKIRNTYGNKIAGQVISLADIPACPFPWEMKLAAQHFANGGRIEDIPEMERTGVLEDFPDEPVPNQNESIGSEMRL